MLEPLHAALQALRYPQTRHAALVHLPVAISLIGFLAVLLVAALRGRNRTMTWATVALFALGVGTAFVTTNSGDKAEDNLNLQAMDSAAQEELSIHESMADWVWVFMAATGTLVALSAIPKKSIRVTMLVLALLCASATAGWVAVTADHGGHLVYQFGVGVPQSPNNLPWPNTPAATQP